MSELIELASLFGLRYYMLEEKGPQNHIILVKNEEGKSAKFCLETGEQIVSVDTSSKQPLSIREIQKAKRDIRDFGEDFLDYWNDLISPVE